MIHQHLHQSSSGRTHLVLEPINVPSDLPAAIFWVQLPLNVLSSGSKISHELDWTTNDFVAAFCNNRYILAGANIYKLLVYFLFTIEGVDWLEMIVLLRYFEYSKDCSSVRICIVSPHRKLSLLWPSVSLFLAKLVSHFKSLLL